MTDLNPLFDKTSRMHQHRTIRIVSHKMAGGRTVGYAPKVVDSWWRQQQADRVMPDDAPLKMEPVELTPDLTALVGDPGRGAGCRPSGEGIDNGWEVAVDGGMLYRACPGEAYCASLDISLAADRIETDHAARTARGSSPRR